MISRIQLHTLYDPLQHVNDCHVVFSQDTDGIAIGMMRVLNMPVIIAYNRLNHGSGAHHQSASFFNREHHTGQCLLSLVCVFKAHTDRSTSNCKLNCLLQTSASNRIFIVLGQIPLVQIKRLPGLGR